MAEPPTTTARQSSADSALPEPPLDLVPERQIVVTARVIGRIVDSALLRELVMHLRDDPLPLSHCWGKECPKMG